MPTVFLLIVSNVFMTIAWYAHLKHQSFSLWKVIVVSWLIAFFEYCFQVPGNRIGSRQFSVAQLKMLQEVITLVVFIMFVKFYFESEPIRGNYIAGFACILLAVFFFQPASAVSTLPL